MTVISCNRKILEFDVGGLNKLFAVIMIFPIIEGTRMKNSDKKGTQMASSVDQFGLGIQVFKIDSMKLNNDDKGMQRKTMKNIENPSFNKGSAPLTKKTQALPSLSVEKKFAITAQKQSLKKRGSTIQKIKKPYVPTSSKDIDQKRVIVEKKPATTQQAPKNVQPDQTATVPKEKEIIYQHYRQSFNQIEGFYQRMQEADANNTKEIRRLKKQKQNAEQAIEWRMKCKADKRLLLEELVSQDKQFFDDQDDEFDEFNMTDYVKNGYQFKSYDCIDSVQ